ncbi:MAG: nitrous oxide reductase accessory protein NosL, partial [Candidatus Accumulibacter sp.]|nr:nitrous oxide reductase accessory protein NosL [Candidatus Accumulibacter proximus]
IFSDGTAHFFDSPVDLFMFLDQTGRFDPSHTAADLAALYVADYRSGAWLDARSAAFVIGSAVRGPMRGPDLPAFADQVTARIFAGEHGGRVLLSMPSTAARSLTCATPTTPSTPTEIAGPAGNRTAQPQRRSRERKMEAGWILLPRCLQDHAGEPRLTETWPPCSRPPPSRRRRSAKRRRRVAASCPWHR